MARWKIALFTVVIMVSLLSAGCSNKVKPGSSDVKRPIISGITLAEVGKSTIDEYNETAGTIKAKNVSIIARK